MTKSASYGAPGFCRQYWALSTPPATLEQVQAQLATLREIEQARPGYDLFRPSHYSKRRARLVKTFWAFRHTEQ